MNRYFLSIALGVLAAGTANAAPLTVEGGLASSERVSYADLSLDRQAGIMTLRSRISAAARRLCVTSNVAPLAEKAREMRCYRTAVADAYDQMHRRAGHENRRHAATAATLGATG
jgi:UrcA family protein